MCFLMLLNQEKFEQVPLPFINVAKSKNSWKKYHYCVFYVVKSRNNWRKYNYCDFECCQIKKFFEEISLPCFQYYKINKLLGQILNVFNVVKLINAKKTLLRKYLCVNFS